MTSLRHNEGAGDLRDAYLDAARDSLLDLGWRRTTLTEVARRAGVSRMTIYRSWADMPTLLADLMTREWGDVLEKAAGASADGTVEQLVERVVAAVDALRSHELFVRIVEVDPELILPYLLSRRGRSQDHVLAVLTGAVARGQEDGEVRPGNPVAIARSIVLAAHGFVLSQHTMVDDEVGEPELEAELRLLLRRVLAP